MTPKIPSWSDILRYAANVTAEGEIKKIESIHLAEKKRADAALAGDLNEARLWRDVWVYLMAKKYVMQNKQG